MSNGGMVNVIVKGAPALRSDGACLEGTLATLGTGPKAMSPKALVKVKQDALDLLARVATAYEKDVAEGEVGADGSGEAGNKKPTSSSCTGLLYGRIQSGKTVAMIALVAAAIDNGFRVVVVLTSDNIKLVDQTTKRFAALEGPIILDALQPDAWTGDGKHIGKHIGKVGLVIVCSKNRSRLEKLIEFLQAIKAPNYPALILDDEADQATPNTNTAKGVKDPDVDPTAIYQKTEDLRNTLRHHVFLQVTATPYALLLQSVGTQLRPSFSRLLEPGEGYTGGECFFEQEHIEGPKPPLVLINKHESEVIGAGVADAPDGLRRALAFFLIAAAVQSINDPATAKGGQNFLCHTSQLREQHFHVEKLIRDYIDKISTALDAKKGEPLDKLHLAYDDLKRTMPVLPPLDDVLEQVAMRLVSRRVIVMNAPKANQKPPELGKGLNFIIGGNIIGRGVTIENLFVTYYVREPKTGQMDTTLQHARMYGYRGQIMPLTRVFLPLQLALRFHEIHNIEKRLRRNLATADMNRPIAIERAKNLSPTRRSVLDPTYIDMFDATDQVYPTHPDLQMKPKAYNAMTEKIQHLVDGELNAEKDQLELIDFDELLWLVDNLPYNEDEPSSSWVPGVLLRVLELQRKRCGDKAYLYTRKMNRKASVFVGGALSSKELERLRKLDRPVICAFRDDGKSIEEQPANKYWYPTLVFDQKMQSVLINVTPDGE